MGEKDDTKKEASDKKPADAEGGPVTVVLKVDLHCDGCAKKIKKSVSQFEGVESVKADTAGNKLTVTGKVDPTRVKDRVEFKTKKKAEILSPQPKKDVEKKENLPEKKSDDKKTDDNKPKEPQSTTVVLKIPLHCAGCIHKIKRVISKVDGVESVVADAGKDLVTVKGTMNVKELIPHLKEKFKRKVDIAPPKPEDKGGETKDDKKEKVEGDGDKNKGGGDKAAASGGDGENKSKGIEVVNKLEYHGQDPHTYTMQMFGPGYYNQDYGIASSSNSNHGYVYQGYNHGYAMDYPRSYAPPMSPPTMYINDPRVMYQQPDTGMFSDENPNGCSVM
ncbi:heavy metal-associated isoprenylated plant protein 5-like [Bidens hawaiensis]|uniref:heavy metal-associated isoprenylated plant protein 5-like n=1 Tax=Bidens hawaiensis TaxID=980011 RepID=UPI004049B473